MRGSVKEFLKIARVELEELLDNIEYRIDLIEKRKAESLITEHVYLENKAVFMNEVCCFRRFLHCLESVRPEAFRTVDEALEFILREFASQVHDCGYAPCALSFAERRLRKATRYVLADADED